LTIDVIRLLPFVNTLNIDVLDYFPLSIRDCFVNTTISCFSLKLT